MPVSNFGDVMREFKAGRLHSGKGGPVVTNPAQAKAIGVSMTSGKSKKARGFKKLRERM